MEPRKSLWQTTSEIPRREPLPGSLHADVAILGAGMAGALTAYQLKRHGLRAVVLEADRIAGGQTGHTTAKITSQHGVFCDALIRSHGAERALQYVRANQEAVREYAAIVREKGVDCGFRETFACAYSTANADPMEQEADAARRLGLDARFVAETELPFPVAGAVRVDGQAQFHPLKFLRAVCEDLEIYEDTRALNVEGGLVHTNRGDVRAQRIVFATHFPFVNVPGWYFMRMHQERSHVLALRSGWLPEGMYIGADDDGLSFREAEGLLLLGGGSHRTGENSAGGQYDGLRDRARTLLPDCREVACWSAQDCVTLDGVPYVGQYAPSRSDWFVATGFAKWGMTGSMAAALLLSGLLCGDPPDWAAVFDPARFTPSASAKNLATETAQSFKGLTRGLLAVPQTALDQLPPGHGGIVDVDGRKAGVFKDADGQCHIVDPRCPHLGCQLAWNPDEHTWDCPCHGSRFRYDGTLIDNPAQEGLQ